MNLPSEERRVVNRSGTYKLWIYGAPFSGKSTFANKSDTPLFICTDNNYQYIDAPYVHLENKIYMEGRIKKQIYAWQTFKETISSLFTSEHKFKTIVIDLVEDLYNFCSNYVCSEKLKLEYEGDAKHGKGWNELKREFWSVMEPLLNSSKFNVILISHSINDQEILLDSGDKIKTLVPNITLKVANKLAGKVALVGATIRRNKNYYLSFKKSLEQFGGGRIDIREEINLNIDDFLRMYREEGGKESGK